MSRFRPLGALVLLQIVLCSCAQTKPAQPEPTVEVPVYGESRTIIGDGLELRSFRVTTSLEELQRVLQGVGGTLVSSEELTLGGIELYDVPQERIEDFTLVVTDGRAWNTRWLGQQFEWTNLLPGVASYTDGEFSGWVALPGRSWSSMMEDGPVVVLEAVPVVGTRQIGWGGERPMERFRMEHVLRPGRALVLFGGTGLALNHEVDLAGEPGVPESLGQTVGQQLMMAGVSTRGDGSGHTPDIAAGSVLVLLPQFTGERRMPPPPAPR